jgi:hypothetical protein
MPPLAPRRVITVVTDDKAPDVVVLRVNSGHRAEAKGEPCSSAYTWLAVRAVARMLCAQAIESSGCCQNCCYPAHCWVRI